MGVVGILLPPFFCVMVCGVRGFGCGKKRKNVKKLQFYSLLYRWEKNFLIILQPNFAARDSINN